MSYASKYSRCTTRRKTFEGFSFAILATSFCKSESGTQTFATGSKRSVSESQPIRSEGKRAHTTIACCHDLNPTSGATIVCLYGSKCDPLREKRLADNIKADRAEDVRPPRLQVHKHH